MSMCPHPMLYPGWAIAAVRDMHSLPRLLGRLRDHIVVRSASREHRNDSRSEVSVMWMAVGDCRLLGKAGTARGSCSFRISIGAICFNRVILQVSIHILGIKIRLLAETSMRNAFYKVGQSLLVRRELELEKQLKEKMIHSVMPPSVAQWLMNNSAEDDDDQNQSGADSALIQSKQSADRVALQHQQQVNRMIN